MNSTSNSDALALQPLYEGPQQQTHAVSTMQVAVQASNQSTFSACDPSLIAKARRQGSATMGLACLKPEFIRDAMQFDLVHMHFLTRDDTLIISRLHGSADEAVFQPGTEEINLTDENYEGKLKAAKSFIQTWVMAGPRMGFEILVDCYTLRLASIQPQSAPQIEGRLGPQVHEFDIAGTLADGWQYPNGGEFVMNEGGDTWL